MNVVISQPMLFPWVGMFEQIRLADVFVYYDDVQFSKGSFTNRVQLKSEKGVEWMTIPLKKLTLGQKINEVKTSDQTDWRQKHLNQLYRCYNSGSHYGEMISLVESVYGVEEDSLSEIAILSMDEVCKYFGLDAQTKFLRSSMLNIDGSSSQRVLDIVLSIGGSCYITGHGAKNYLDHELFEKNGVRVEYMDYEKRPYPQLNGPFTPYVSMLDMIANVGQRGADLIVSKTKYWKDFINE